MSKELRNTTYYKKSRIDKHKEIFVKACLKRFFLGGVQGKGQKVNPVFHKQKNSTLEECIVLK